MDFIITDFHHTKQITQYGHCTLSSIFLILKFKVRTKTNKNRSKYVHKRISCRYLRNSLCPVRFFKSTFYFIYKITVPIVRATFLKFLAPSIRFTAILRKHKCLFITVCYKIVSECVSTLISSSGKKFQLIAAPGPQNCIQTYLISTHLTRTYLTLYLLGIESECCLTEPTSVIAD
jgi:hypothetical protein